MFYVPAVDNPKYIKCDQHRMIPSEYESEYVNSFKYYYASRNYPASIFYHNIRIIYLIYLSFLYTLRL